MLMQHFTKNKIITKSKTAHFIIHALCYAMLLSFWGCSSSKKLTHEQTCNDKFNDAQKKYDKKHYTEVRDPLRDLISACNGFSFTEQAYYELADSYYQLGDWIEAQSEYMSFLKDYPSSKKYGELAQFRLAETAAKQVEIPARDQSQTVEAIDEFNKFISYYPESQYADSAKNFADKLRKQLVEKEMLIARLYTRMGEPQGAAVYYKGLIKDYPGYIDLRDIHMKLVDCYIALQQFEEAESYLAKFDGVAKDDPFLAKVKDGYTRLEKAKSKYAAVKKQEADKNKPQEAL